MLYVDSPAGVGYSYDANGQHGPSHHYVSDDTRVIDDLVEFLRGFAALYPDVMRSDLYIAGASTAAAVIDAAVFIAVSTTAAAVTTTTAAATAAVTIMPLLQVNRMAVCTSHCWLSDCSRWMPPAVQAAVLEPRRRRSST
jgi:carboxypeptidase C (cathepsin A)